MADMVNHPSHYNQNGVETIDIIEDTLTSEEFEGFLVGNIIKYLDRHKYKNGHQDLEKAQWYAKKLYQYEGGDLEEYEPWFIELHEGNFKTAVRLWEEIS